MSDKQIEIKGRMFSEETIIEALKAHIDWSEEYEVGDVLSFINGEADRLVTRGANGLRTIDRFGRMCGTVPALKGTYTRLGRCTGFAYEAD